MVPSNFVLVLALWPLVFVHHFDFASSSSRPVVSKDDVLPSESTTGACVNCTICQYPCHTLSPPPPPLFSGYPLYGAPPPPPSPSEYPSYGAPVPPKIQGNCPPGQVQCCQYPPPNPYTYLPNESHSPSPNHPSITTTFISTIMLLASFAALF